MSDLDSILTYIYSKQKRGHHSPSVIKDLLKLVGSPELAYKTIYITGTNGKGTTSHVTARMLETLGFKVGLFTSPYVITFLERFQVNHNNILELDFIRLFNKLEPLMSNYEGEHDITLSFFDVLTFIAFVYFKEQNVDYLVLEGGIGVLYDSTNVVDPLYSIITSIGFDHEDKLGSTLEEVAFNKGNIIKRNKVTYTYDDNPSVSNVLRDIARNKGGAVKFVPYPTNITYNAFDTTFNVLDKTYKTALLGAYQPYNLNLAIMALKDYFEITDEQILTSLTYPMPCRFERICNFILDGAHNTHAINSLVKSLELYNLKDVLICFSALRDKDYLEMIDLLKDYEICFYLFDDRRSVLEYPSGYKVYTDLKELLHIKDRTILFTGSLHFVSYVRSLLVS